MGYVYIQQNAENVSKRQSDSGNLKLYVLKSEGQNLEIRKKKHVTALPSNETTSECTLGIDSIYLV